VSAFVGFDGTRRPFVCCCGVIAYLEHADMEHRAFLWLRRHCSKYHRGEWVPTPIPRRDLGLVDWMI
jgi:hypothetical protein